MLPSQFTLKVVIASAHLVIACSSASLAQSRNNSADTTTVNYDAKLIQRNYCYPSFITSTVTFKDSSVVQAPLNYNMLLREMHFLTEAGDTMALANGGGIAHIQIKEDLFQFVAPYGFLWIVASFRNLNLSAQLMTETRVVGSGTLAKTVMIAMDKDSTGSTRIRDMRGQTIYAHLTHYFLVDKNSTPYKVSKPNLQKLYPNYRREINQYINKNSNSLTKREELIKLLQYVDQLSVQ
ncbi:hypothetical protein [Telluribacter humicola]|uniref:hypothetical protein n=1 Tax=Telluribacter humicola TaxID=1720261 RepID=UPI001A956BCD|nr:hypothetical protein [Telluribacter humicola]